jgi:hypothetical protein
MTRIFTRLGIVLLAIFFDLAACILISLALALLWRGTPFDVIWWLAPERRLQLWPYRLWLAPLFLACAIPATLASYGFFQRRPWARQLAIAIFTANAVGDAMQIARGHSWDGALGVTVAGLSLLFLTSPAVRAEFEGPALSG